jgi:hypothetical protein
MQINFVTSFTTNLSHEMVSIDGVLRAGVVVHAEVKRDGVDGVVVLNRALADINLKQQEWCQDCYIYF